MRHIDDSLERGLKIQREQLLDWRRKLSAECYCDLTEWVAEQNAKLAPDAKLWDVVRGCSIENFILNWPRRFPEQC